MKINKKKKKYNYKDIIAIYDFKKKMFLEKITPKNVEYKDSYGETFFAERLTNGKILIYKYLTNRSHSHLSAPNAEKKINYIEGNNPKGSNITVPFVKRGNTDRFGRSSSIGKTYSSGSSRSFFSYYIGIKGFKQKLLCYNEIQMTKNTHKILNSYLKDNNIIRLALEDLFFSEEEVKESSIIELVNKYNEQMPKRK
ncbi:hypothetical protein [Polaribacter sp. Hel_I_88]|uniref:hypothetical protein n=1 Tax=Polaribacter sp. Hel_I_88 TaxID=1250006 RepID=UPI0012DEC24B|nr:hypothetical protein [Polaribacter sp. Hel_I_88]